MKRIVVINGPNLNMLGFREPQIYGVKTLDELNAWIVEQCTPQLITLLFYQSNCEGELISRIQQCSGACEGIVINPGAYAHYSYAIYDALKSVDVPSIEVHISDIYNREAFRRVSVTAPACIDLVCGQGYDGYVVAIKRLLAIE